MTRGHLRQHIQQLKAGDHICLIYQDLAEQMEVVVPYFHEGLDRGECCVYVVDDRIASQVIRALTRAGVDVNLQMKRGALILLNKHRAYIHAGKFNPQEELERLEESYQEKMKSGFSGLRVTSEMTWALGTEPGCGRLMEYEIAMNQFILGRQLMYLCQYNAHRFPASVIPHACQAHAQIISEGRMSPRPQPLSQSTVPSIA